MSKFDYSFSVGDVYSGEPNLFEPYDVNADVEMTVTAQNNETAGRLVDEIEEAVEEIVDEETTEDNSYEPETAVDAFEATVWGAVLSGEKDFLTRREMALSLQSIADDIYPDSLD